MNDLNDINNNSTTIYIKFINIQTFNKYIKLYDEDQYKIII